MSHYNKIAGKRLHRIESLSDGVFAIAMTIQIFNLKDPVTKIFENELDFLYAIKPILPTLLTYFLSFITLGIFWTGHTTQFNYIKKYDRNINWISLFFLLFVSLLPFTTGFLGNHINNKISVFIYWFNVFALGALLYTHWFYARKHNLLDIDKHDIVPIDLAIRKRIITAQSLYAFGSLLCFINDYLSIIFIIMIQTNYAFAFFQRKHRV